MSTCSIVTISTQDAIKLSFSRSSFGSTILCSFPLNWQKKWKIGTRSLQNFLLMSSSVNCLVFKKYLSLKNYFFLSQYPVFHWSILPYWILYLEYLLLLKLRETGKAKRQIRLCRWIFEVSSISHCKTVCKGNCARSMPLQNSIKWLVTQIVLLVLLLHET